MSGNLINEWEIRLSKAQIGHYLAAEKYQKIHYFMGALLIIFSALVASSLFLETQTGWIKNFILVASILSTVLAGFQTLVRPSEQAEIHRSKAASYGSLRRKIELYLSTNKPNEVDERTLLEIKNEWDSIADNSPVTPHGLRKKSTDILNSEFRDDSDFNSLKNKK